MAERLPSDGRTAGPAHAGAGEWDAAGGDGWAGVHNLGAAVVHAHQPPPLPLQVARHPIGCASRIFPAVVAVVCSVACIQTILTASNIGGVRQPDKRACVYCQQGPEGEISGRNQGELETGREKGMGLRGVVRTLAVAGTGGPVQNE
eukprot:280428-Prorocentrum_minimum.AAC.1